MIKQFYFNRFNLAWPMFALSLNVKQLNFTQLKGLDGWFGFLTCQPL